MLVEKSVETHTHVWLNGKANWGEQFVSWVLQVHLPLNTLLSSAEIKDFLQSALNAISKFNNIDKLMLTRQLYYIFAIQEVCIGKNRARSCRWGQ